MKAEELKAAIRQFIIENFLFGQDASGLRDETSLLEQGIIDSTGVLELVAFLENNHGLSVADEDLVPQNFDSIDNLAVYIARKSPRG